MVQIRAHAIKEKSGSAEPFSYERAVGSHDVLVRITHCSIARGDIQFMDNEWGDARFPLVPGHEIVGIVEALGSEVADLQRGDRVFLHAMGHSVTAFSHSRDKRELIEGLGAAFADSSDSKSMTGHHGAFCFVLSTLNVAFDLDSYVRMLNPQGQLCLVASPLEPLSLSGGLLNNSGRSVYGNYIGSRANTMQMLEFSAQHGIGAIVDVMPFARVNEAIERVRRRDVRVGLVLENRELDTATPAFRRA
jgi:D-arabinose 1-dehydrogenase-like Zn-dependent alcohol dehydrogenase